MTRFVLAAYDKRVADGEIEFDPAQRRAAGHLNALAQACATRLGVKSKLGRFFSANGKEHPRGLYIHGQVGRGKTMLMDLFFSCVPVERKRRVHFHEFMADVHERIAQYRAMADGDPLQHVARDLARETSLLCLDEVQVTDIADAMILGRLFHGLFEGQTPIVATSNSAPSELYKDGLNRALFLPVIGLLQDRLDIVELKAAKDFRLEKLSGRRLYFTPCNGQSEAELDGHWERLTGHHPIEPVVLEVKGRRLAVDRASMGVARFSFSDLCERPLGSIDYLHLAHAFHTVMIENIPRLGPEKRNEARRFINLIDTLYDQHVCLIASAEAEPHEIYAEGDGRAAFERTASRLIEMRSEAYLTQR